MTDTSRSEISKGPSLFLPAICQKTFEIPAAHAKTREAFETSQV